MTLQEFLQHIETASKRAHLFVADGYGVKAIKSVSLRVDDDGVLSIVLHQEHMPNRYPHEHAKEVMQALQFSRQLAKDEPGLKDAFSEFDGFYVHWNVVADALSQAGDTYQDWTDSPLDLVNKLIDERDQLKQELQDRDKLPVAAEAAVD